MIGAKSIVLNVKVKNNNGNPYHVKVQANKNLGLCDIILPAGKEAFRNTVLNEYQGRPLTHNLFNSISTTLYELLNKTEL